MKKRRILLSTDNKTGLEKFLALKDRGYEFVSTGGTAKELRGHGLEVIDVSEVTGLPEMMDGRLKTLHPNIHGGILAVRSDCDHERAVFSVLKTNYIDVVVCNCYDFASDERIERIDIGGPTMISGAAKNHLYVTVLTNPNDYDEAIRQILEHGSVQPAFRHALAGKAFLYLGEYYTGVAHWFGSKR